MKSGYEIRYEGVVEYEVEIFWQMDLVKLVKPQIELIEIQSLEIDNYAEQTNSDYGGWGVEVKV